MHILVVGVNHKTAHVEVREKLYYCEPMIPEMLRKFRAEIGSGDLALLSTCNRTEIYAATEDMHACRRKALDCLAGEAGEAGDKLRSAAYSMADEEAVRHLFRIASGLDSLVLGEGQILGQVRKTGELARNAGTTGKTLSAFFRQAVATGKRARAETAIARNAVSVSSAAVELAGALFGGLNRKTALIIGAGKIGELSVKHLRSAGLTTALVTNRTYERAVELAARFEGRPMRFEELDEAMRAADIVISSTGSTEPVVDRERMRNIMRLRKNKPVFIVDIAVPRDFDPKCSTVPNCFLYNIDDLKQVVDKNLSERRKEVAKVEKIVTEETARFMSWLDALDVLPVITGFRSHIQKIRDEELQRFNGKLQNLSEEDRKLVEQLTWSIVQKVMHEPTVKLKELREKKHGAAHAEALKKLFGLEIGGEEESE